jgi:hypothetical protein
MEDAAREGYAGFISPSLVERSPLASCDEECCDDIVVLTPRGFSRLRLTAGSDERDDALRPSLSILSSAPEDVTVLAGGAGWNDDDSIELAAAE